MTPTDSSKDAVKPPVSHPLLLHHNVICAQPRT